MKPSIYERWAAKVQVAPECLPGMDTPCWLWTGRASPRGYGALSVGASRSRLAHRVGYELNVGPIPDGMVACHRCDNPKCVAPHHIFIGSQGDNMRDMVSKGRHVAAVNPERVARGDRHGRRTRPERTARGDRCGARTMPHRVPRGERCRTAVATEEKVRMVRATKPSIQEAMSILGVGESSAYRILSGATWKHVVV